MTITKCITILFLFVTGLITSQGQESHMFSAAITDSKCEACLNVDDIQFVDIEDLENDDLGFDTWYYLPNDFDAYSGMQPELSEIEYVEECELMDMEVDFQKHLPKNFNLYVGQ